MPDPKLPDVRALNNMLPFAMLQYSFNGAVAYSKFFAEFSMRCITRSVPSANGFYRVLAKFGCRATHSMNLNTAGQVVCNILQTSCPRKIRYMIIRFCWIGKVPALFIGRFFADKYHKDQSMHKKRLPSFWSGQANRTVSLAICTLKHFFPTFGKNSLASSEYPARPYRPIIANAVSGDSGNVAVFNRRIVFGHGSRPPTRSCQEWAFGLAA